MRMRVIKPHHNYWFNFGTGQTGEPFFRILITRERSGHTLRETLDYFVTTQFSARIDLIREGPEIKETSDIDLILAKFPPPKDEIKYSLHSNSLGFEIRIKKTELGRTAQFNYQLGRVRYSVLEEISPTFERYKYYAAVNGERFGIQPVVESIKREKAWETSYFLLPDTELRTPASFSAMFSQVFGVIFGYDCYFLNQLKQKSWPLSNLQRCSGAPSPHAQ